MYNYSGWLGVKHQLAYFLWYIIWYGYHFCHYTPPPPPHTHTHTFSLVSEKLTQTCMSEFGLNNKGHLVLSALRWWANCKTQWRNFLSCRVESSLLFKACRNGASTLNLRWQSATLDLRWQVAVYNSEREMLTRTCAMSPRFHFVKPLQGLRHRSSSESLFQRICVLPHTNTYWLPLIYVIWYDDTHTHTHTYAECMYTHVHTQTQMVRHDITTVVDWA